MPDAPPGQPGYPWPPERPTDEPGDQMDPYYNPPAPPGWPGQPAYPGEPTPPGQGGPGGYRGHPAPHPRSQPPAPSGGYGWNTTAPPDQSSRQMPPPPPSYRGPGYTDSGYTDSGYNGPGYTDPGYNGPGYSDPGYTDPGYTDPGLSGPGGYPSPTGPGPRRAKRRTAGHRKTWAALAIAALAVTVIGGVFYVVLRHTADQTSAQGGRHSQPSHSPSPAPTHRGDLRRYLVAAPHGSESWPKPLGTNRKLSLGQASHLSTDSKARRATLFSDRFRQGAVQCWIAKSGAWVDVRLYQFGSAALAQDFFHTDIRASSRTTPAVDQSGVPDVPGARAFADAKPDSDGYLTVLVIGVKGDVVFLVDMAEHTSTAHLGAPDRLMGAQYSKL
jgi:hypothetical protein